jgi:hypothetical protein
LQFLRPVKVRPVLAYIAFAFMLLSQQLGIVHAISHLSSDVHTSASQKKQLPAELQCAQCLAFAAIGSGLTSAASPLALPNAVTDAHVAAARIVELPSPSRAFDSRAPPVRS